MMLLIEIALDSSPQRFPYIYEKRVASQVNEMNIS